MATGKFCIVVLAAGASSRLGQPKQLLVYRDKTLVEHAVSTALQSGADEVIVVVGAQAELVQEKLSGLPVRIVMNEDWQEGMGGSIRCGVTALSPNTACVVVALCDQPHVTADLLRGLAEKHFETGSPIVASSYEGLKGAPCAFGREMFPALAELKGDSGARDLIRNSPVPVQTVEFSGGVIDVDSPEDYQKLAFEFADQMSWKMDGPMPSREERNAR